MKIFRFCLPGILGLCIAFGLSSCHNKAPADYFRDADFNADWVFHMGDIGDPTPPAEDLTQMVPVHLPHDWSIIDYQIQDSLHTGPFYKELPGGVDVGYLRDGIAWYFKEFVSPEEMGGTQIILGFDGVQSQMELWVNGTLIGEHVYGYTPFVFDIAPALKGPGENNLIAVKTLNPGENSRWFAGAGIYRPVTLTVLRSVAIDPWGVFVTTPEVSADYARIDLAIEVSNGGLSDVEVNGEIVIHSPETEKTIWKTESLAIRSNSTATLKVTGIINEPALWDIHQPSLYQAEVILYSEGTKIDEYSTTFGIRSIVYGVRTGFLLNGKEILMKGACMHHDNGLLGAAAFKDAEYRRVERMKENGYNAIRTSHNPPSAAFLDACDEIGMLVIDEAFDHWERPKRPNDYSNYFHKWHIRDVRAMVYRDRNHPSVVMWSFGNEVQERADPDGVETGKILAEAIKEVDDTRPVTQAVCAFWDQPGKEWDYSAGAFSMVDIGGYNYQLKEYESDHLKFPERMMYGSETFPKDAWENWELVQRLPYVFGDFVWTGMDYIGESGIGHNYFIDSGETLERTFLRPWPWYISWCGDLDILGNKKPQSYYRDILWGESKLEIMVSTPIPDGKEPWVSFWGWQDELSSWNWQAFEGVVMEVKVYSSYPEVLLELNGEVIGRVQIDSMDRYTARFEVPFSPGKLKASAYREGKLMETLALQTSGTVSQVQLDEEKSVIPADKNSLAFIHVRALDSEGILVPSNDSPLRVRVSGPAKLLAAGNANPEHQGSFTDPVFQLFRGKGLVIVRSTGEPGIITVEAESKGLKPGSVTLVAK